MYFLAKKLPKTEPGGRNPQQGGTVPLTEPQGGQKSGCCGGK